MIHHTNLDFAVLFRKIRNKEISYAGNKNLKIYGKLNCSSGKRTKKENRVFFVNDHEAKNRGYRPCGNCMKAEYKRWKQVG